MIPPVDASVTFKDGLRDGYPLYALVKRPDVPLRATSSYGAGMLTSGVAGTVVGVVPLAAYWMLHGSAKRSGPRGLLGNIALGAAGLWAVAHVPAGIAAGFQGARMIATKGDAN